MTGTNTPRDESPSPPASNNQSTGGRRPALLRICERRSGASHELELSGELDIQGAPRLEHAIRRQANNTTAITLDLRQLSFIDSIGQRAILACLEYCRQNAYTLTLRPGPPHVQTVFETTGLLDRLPFVTGDESG